ncbi:MAG: hypothetical protein M1834_008298 [Cirrosporium novae-zelandiae]|nr:MAG: hypothetical protein M1834_008298 [Cirrosporium novae-zelandiae]
MEDNSISYSDFHASVDEAAAYRIQDGVIPSPEAISSAITSLTTTLPETGHGLSATKTHLLQDIVPGLNGSSLSPNYYGFVNGGITPAARLGEEIVSRFDQNVQVHLPSHSVSTFVENAALQMLQDLLGLDKKAWRGRTFTTGATASNVLGLACGREAIIEAGLSEQRLLVETGLEPHSSQTISVGEMGLLAACQAAGINTIRILTTSPHSSLLKAASIIGLGRLSVQEIPQAENPWRFDLQKLAYLLAQPGTANIISISAGEVNTGFYATTPQDLQTVRSLATTHNAWIHVDGAFGLFALALPADDQAYTTIRAGCVGLEKIADSIAGDAHKLLNVPYDTGFFFTRHADLPSRVFSNPSAAYLTSSSSSDPSHQNPSTSSNPQIPSPLNTTLENSRRFRALPVYSTLHAYGHTGHTTLLKNLTTLARTLASYLHSSPHYELLPPGRTLPEIVENTFIIVLFRAKDPKVNEGLERRINETRRIFVGGTVWAGRRAVRIAVGNWGVDVQREFERVRGVLEEVVVVG